MLFENNNFNSYLDMFYGMPMDNKMMVPMTNNNETSEGFLRGNMFKDEYEPYKNYTYMTPKIKSEKEKLLFKIMEEGFAVIDYGLYLDVHPDDKMVLNKFKTSADRKEKLCKEYEEKYGPLTLAKANYNNYKWVESPWPWEGEDGYYV